MHWLNILAVFFVLNKTALSWKGTPYGQVSCDSRLQCLLQSSSSAHKRKQETAPARDINTWYPIPKWKVFFDANKNSSEYSSPYFNKLNPKRADGNIHDNDFPPVLEHKKRAEVFERLNIQFLPLRDGNITVKSFQGKINASGTEYVALFVVYAHSSNMDIARTRNNSGGDSETKKLEMELMNRKANMSEACDGPGGCLRNDSVVDFPFPSDSVTENKLFPKGEKVVSIPVTKNMSIEMKTGKIDNNNYTVMILPFDKIMNETEVASGGMAANVGEIINITLTKNMNMVVKIGDFFDILNAADNNFTNINDLHSEGTESGDTSKNEVEKNESNITAGYSDILSNQNSTTTLSTVSSITENTESFLYDNNHEMVSDTSENVSTSSTVNETASTIAVSDLLSNFNSTDSMAMGNLVQNLTNKNSNEEYEINAAQTNVPSINQSKTQKVSNTQQNESSYVNKKVNYPKQSKSHLVPYQAIYSRQFGPYEVKEINSNHSSFIATIHLTIHNTAPDNRNVSEDSINDEKLNDYQSNKNDLRNILLRKTFQRRKRYASNENSNERRKLHHIIYNAKQKIISDGYFSHENEISNKYSSRTSRMILNKAGETTQAAGTMKQYSLILPGESTKEQSNSSRLFLFSEGTDSYSYATISNGNEEFNQKSTDKFRNKGLIANEISDNAVGADGAKSNQTAHGVRNKRELALPTLIPNKDSRENHSVPKKSELQIVEGGSLDKRSDDWKMKIPPGVQYLRENGIKIGKICDLRDGCKGESDVFNTMTESENHKKDGAGRESFHSDENLKKERIGKKIEIPNHSSNIKTPEKSINTEDIYRRVEEFKVNSEIILPSKKWGFDNSYINSLQKPVIPNTEIPTQNTYTNNVSQDVTLKSGMNKARYSTFGWNQFFKEERNYKNQAKISPLFNEKIGNLKQGKQANNNFLKISPTLVNLLRKRRTVSQILPITNPTNLGYLTDLNTFTPLSSQQLPRGVITQIGNITLSPLSGRRYAEDSQQNYILQLLHRSSTGDRENSPPFNPEFKLKEWWFQRGSPWLPRSRHNKWHPHDQRKDHVLPHNIIPAYRWVIIVPEITEHFRPKFETKPWSKRPFPNHMVQPPKNSANPDLEKEGNEWLNTEWVLIDSVNESGKRKKVNMKMPPTDPATVNIINMPKKTPTTMKPPRKAVSDDDNNGKKNSNPGTTKKPSKSTRPPITKKPAWPPFHTTSDPWSFDKPWDKNYWSVSRNPWKWYPTTPMMMMNGMAGGD